MGRRDAGFLSSRRGCWHQHWAGPYRTQHRADDRCLLRWRLWRRQARRAGWRGWRDGRGRWCQCGAGGFPRQRARWRLRRGGQRRRRGGALWRESRQRWWRHVHRLGWRAVERHERWRRFQLSAPGRRCRRHRAADGSVGRRRAATSPGRQPAITRRPHRRHDQLTGTARGDPSPAAWPARGRPVMAGLLDAISGNWTDDPNQNAAIRQGLLSGVFGAMAGRGNRMQALGQGGLLGLSGYSSTLAAQEQAARDAQAREMQALQTQNLRSQLERQQAMQGLAKQFYRPEQTMPGEMTQPEPQAAFRAAELTGTLPQSQMGAPRTIPAGFDFAGYADALAQFDPVESARLRASLQKDRTPLKVGRGETLLDPETRQPIYTSQAAEDMSTIGQLMSEMSRLPPDDPRRPMYMDAIKKATTHAPGTSVSVNTGQKGLENEIKLRGDFRSEPVYKAQQEVQSAYAQIDRKSVV